ncbi:hypothetical protein [Kocuria sp.]|uniref:hypothetical protein n=1 Tax=Kocuria sp. TaxID=1871328 RepID=UPI0026492E23|nr:hypothetical protein [Kocuria sp.]MDN5631561.1 hypothetical protein [Kocuria sp.]
MSSSARPRVPAPLRSLAAALLAVLAGAGFALWLGITWLQDHVLSPSGFQDTAAAVMTETSFQDELVGTVLDRATLGVLQDADTGIAPVDRAVERLRTAVADAARTWLTAPEQEGTWIQVLNDTHDANVPLTPSAGAAPDELVVDLGALGRAVDHQVQDTVGISPGIDAHALRITVPGAHTGPVVDALVRLAQWRYVLPWFAGAAAVLCVLCAPRRWTALAGVGAAGVVCAGILLCLGLVATRTVVNASAVDPVAHLVTEQIFSLLRDSFVTRCVEAMMWAAGVAVVGVTGAVVRVRTVTYDGGHVHRG